MPGLTSGEAAEFVAARKRIAEFEAELAIHGRTSALLAKVVRPNGGLLAIAVMDSEGLAA